MLVVVASGIDPTEAVPPANRPANVRVEQFRAVHRAAAVHRRDGDHTGGYGGVQMALAAGVPLVVAGKTEDKTEVCARVAWSGVGIDLRTNRAAAPTVEAAVRTVLGTESYRRQATEIAQEFAGYDSIDVQVDAVLELVGTRHHLVTGHRQEAAAT